MKNAETAPAKPNLPESCTWASLHLYLILKDVRKVIYVDAQEAFLLDDISRLWAQFHNFAVRTASDCPCEFYPAYVIGLPWMLFVVFFCLFAAYQTG